MMKNLTYCLIVLFVFGYLLLSVNAGYAQDGITVTPSQLTVTGSRGAVEKRTLVFRSNKTIANLRLVPADLPRIDGNTVLPASAVQITPPTDTINANVPLSLVLEVNLKNTSSGEFKGELLLSYEEEETVAIPVTVRVKDSWWGSLIVLFVGVGLSVGVSFYRTRGKPRDEILVRVEQIRAQMKSDVKLVPQFQARIEAFLMDVDAALQAENWKEAEDDIEQAEGILLRWRKGRMDWLEEFAYYAELEQRLQEMPPHTAYIQLIQRDLKDVIRNAPDLEGPDKLEDQLYNLAQQLDQYIRLQTGLDKCNKLRNRLAASQGEQWRLKTLELQRRLDSLKPNDDAAYQALQGDIEATISEMAAIVSQLGGLERTAKGIREVEDTEEALRLTPPAPSAHSLTSEKSISDARTRLKLFTWFSYAIAVILLAGAGFGELYVANPTFGTNAWGDYFALLAWGFGSEATRASLTEMVKGWGLMGGE